MKQKYQLAPNVTETVITHSVTVQGGLKAENDLFFDGVIKGNVTCDGNISVGTNAHITGDVLGKNITVAGEVHGNIKADERLVLSSSARVNGDLTTQHISIAEGAVISGKINMPHHSSNQEPLNNENN
jgi:cytoskeletal protein CcmA (bactofilin family)